MNRRPPLSPDFPLSSRHGLNPCRSAAGASLITVMVSLAITLITVAVAVVAFKQRVQARRLVAAGNAGRDVSAQFTSKLLKNFSAFIKPASTDSLAPCTNTSLINSLNVGANTGTLTLTNNIVLPSTTGTQPSDFAQAVTRCASTAPTLNGVGQAATQVYGCYLFTPAAQSKSLSGIDSFFQAQVAFIEFTGIVQNFETSSTATCGTAGAAPSNSGFGIAGYYALHWVLGNGTTPIFKSKYGVVYSAL